MAASRQAARVQHLHQSALAASAAGDLEGAVAAYEEAVAIDPGFDLGLGNLACLHLQRERVDQAVACLQKVRALAGHRPDIERNFALAHSAYVMGLQYSDRVSRRQLVDAHRRWYAVNGAHLARGRSQPRQARLSAKGRRIRIGFVSPDFYSHPVGMLLFAPLRNIDRNRYEIHLFSDTASRHIDRLSAELKAAADGWHETAALADEALAGHIRSAGIDILIDLAGHTRGNRLRVFCMGAAPVQATWLGYFDTTGIPGIDYAFTTHYLCPLPESDYFSEQPIHFRHTYFSPLIPHFAPADITPTSQADGPLTFACFNNTRKLNGTVIGTWSSILHRLPHARLELRWESLEQPAERERLLALFAANGIAPARLGLGGRLTYDKILECYRSVDVVLDPFPYCGGMTSCDALMMGVPLVSLYADRPAGRQSASFLHQMGMPEMVCHSLEDYVALACWLGGQKSKGMPLRLEIARRFRQHLAGSGANPAEFAELLSRLVSNHFTD